MKTNRREFLGFSAGGVALAASTLSVSSFTRAETAAEHNAKELAAIEANPFSSAAMPSMFSPMVDATGFENHNK